MRGASVMVAVSGLVLVGVLVTQTGAFSAATVDRQISVAVVDDDSAALGFEQSTAANGSTANLTVTVTNRFPGTALDTVAVEVNGSRRELVDGGSLVPGESATGEWTGVPCGDPILVTAAGGGVDATLYRAVDC